MKPLYSMERNKCSLIPFHGVEGFHSTPNSTPERSRTECRSLSIPLYSAQDCLSVPVFIGLGIGPGIDLGIGPGMYQSWNVSVGVSIGLGMY